MSVKMVYGSILLLCFVAIGVLAQRGYLEIFVRRLERQTNMTELEKRKLAFFKHKIRNEHPLALLMVSGLFLLSLLLFTFPHFSLQTQVRRIEKESQQLKQEILHLQKEQMEGMQRPLSVYPSVGLPFESLAWQTLLMADDREARFQLEEEFGTQVTPFLGPTVVLIHIDQPLQEITLTSASHLHSVADFSTWEANLERIIDDLSQAQGVQRCHFVLQVADAPDTSFEQTIVRDAQGQWQVLNRKELAQASDTGA
ncbi:hypothetical protein [Enterococcus casseliflavus]|nr:hypothetical protein [Enterococcus casseliflavus]